ncbi:MAG: HAD family hydrolase [Lachnospiraceae bacterium]|nr:HAD family hydrolase [Lachnospiraceae bacterium]
MKKVVIFDLDGTLIDTSEGIFNSVRYAEKMMGLDAIDEDKLKEFIGPPPKEMYKTLYGLTEEDALLAVKYHRDYGASNGYIESSPYNGIKDLLIELKSNGNILAIGTLKKQEVAESVIKHHKLDDCFDCILGMNDSESLTKALIISSIVDKYGIDKDNVIMVGDSVYDYEGARQVGVRFIGVLYGFGLEANRVHKYSVINSPKELLGII